MVGEKTRVRSKEQNMAACGRAWGVMEAGLHPPRHDMDTGGNAITYRAEMSTTCPVSHRPMSWLKATALSNLRHAVPQCVGG